MTKGTNMGYQEKLGDIIEEIGAMREQEDYPEDIIDEVLGEALAKEREFLMEKLEERLEQFGGRDWWIHSGKYAAYDLLRERLIAERFTPEEKAEYGAHQKAQAVKRAHESLEQALNAQADNERDIETATRLGKPKMLRHYTELQRRRHEQVEFRQRDLARALANAATTDQGGRGGDKAFSG